MDWKIDVLKWIAEKQEKKLEDRNNRVQRERDTRNLLDSINYAHIEWMSAITNFEHVQTKELVDYYAYKIKACQIKYNYLIKKAKESGINLSGNNIAQ